MAVTALVDGDTKGEGSTEPAAATVTLDEPEAAAATANEGIT